MSMRMPKKNKDLSNSRNTKLAKSYSTSINDKLTSLNPSLSIFWSKKLQCRDRCPLLRAIWTISRVSLPRWSTLRRSQIRKRRNWTKSTKIFWFKGNNIWRTSKSITRRSLVAWVSPGSKCKWSLLRYLCIWTQQSLKELWKKTKVWNRDKLNLILTITNCRNKENKEPQGNKRVKKKKPSKSLQTLRKRFYTKE